MTRLSDNALGAVYMTISVLAYVANDAFIKTAANELDLYQAIFLRGAGISLIILVMLRGRVSMGLIRQHLSGPLIVRVGAEVLGTIAFLNALVNMPIADVTAVFQGVPLTVTLAAALFLGEKVGWRRYLAVVVGFLGVLIVVRPTGEGFNAFALLAVIAVILTTIRDLATVKLPEDVPSALVAFLTAVAISLMGLVGSFIGGWAPMNASNLGTIAGAATFLSIGYIFSIKTVRVGELSFSAPFRYTILIGAIVLGILVFDEIPDRPMIIGSILIVAMGLYTFSVERKVHERTSSRVFKNRPGV